MQIHQLVNALNDVQREPIYENFCERNLLQKRLAQATFSVLTLFYYLHYLHYLHLHYLIYNEKTTDNTK